jgi:hypothetical protein
MNRIASAAFAVAAVLFAASTAAAKTIRIHAEGEVAFGYDGGGIFGLGADLTGQPFTYEATLDLSKGLYIDSGVRTDLVGGEAYDYLPEHPPSMGGGVFAINGHSRVIDANSDTTLTAYNDGSSDFDQQSIGLRQTTGSKVHLESVLMQETPGFGLFGPDYVPPSGNLCASHGCSGSNFILSDYDGFDYEGGVYVGLNPTLLTISMVPEPGTWALMLLGAAFAGAGLRRRGPIASRS